MNAMTDILHQIILALTEEDLIRVRHRLHRNKQFDAAEIINRELFRRTAASSD
jgi:hypothetical protein